MSLQRDVRIRVNALLEAVDRGSASGLWGLEKEGHGSHLVPDRLQAYCGRQHRDPEDQVHPVGLGELPRWECVLQQDGAPAHTVRARASVPGAGDGLLGQGLVAPQSSDANPLDYAFWLHIESKACKLRHPNIDAVKAAVNQEWAGMYEDFVKRLMAIVAANGGHIE
ncbi:Uncharacterized protein FKW44_004580 [Caligus rogercresseyi]|uniref:Uncharacterized protein n=1 Tax=Caligus rogercresseyi TaxID=217165 RepID=A0A7T8HMX2_CALRO|nr:Uncharacterized protein FKW44_004580 [Caligus rogercresseyi]